MVRIRLLGGVSAATDDAQPVDVGPAKCQTVLAALALSAGSAVPVPRLVEMVWGEDPPRTAAKTLQSYITRLRKGLGADAIVRTGAAYRLDVAAEAVDVARFRRRLDSGDLEAALAEWTGSPLAGLDAPGLTPAVDGLVELWLRAVEDDLARRVATDAGAVIGPLTELTADHPFREGLWALLMTALYRVGRQADALAAFHNARRHLIDELGVEPGPSLRELEALILEHDEQLGAEDSSTDAGSSRPRGTVTFGFAEVDSPTRLWATHRQKTAAAMARLGELVRVATGRHGGHAFADGTEVFGVAFHRADEAVAWATELQARVASEPWPGGVELQVRIGLHTGETEEQAKGYLGPAVNTAAGLAAAGHGGQTLLSAVTAGLLDRDDLHDLGTYRLDGVLAEQRFFQLGDERHPHLRGEDSRPGNLPLPLDRLIGRGEDLAVLTGALAVHPIVTLVGPGGVGKTRLALAAARMSTDASAAWVVELAQIAASSAVPRAVAATVGISERPGRTLLQSIVAALQSRPGLLVLDNCEHVIDGAAELAKAVAKDCPDVGVLATSREGLRVAGERLIEVLPLDPAGPGVELFNERAVAVAGTFDPHANAHEVEELCRRLDGLPLAIELAAARAATLTPKDLLQRLDDRLRLLNRGRRADVERHRTLRAAIQWSYDLLTPAEQTLFQRLSIFVGPFDLEAAERVASAVDLDAVEVDDLVGRLVERSMLAVEPSRTDPRYRLLETMRQFGAERLADSGHVDLTAGRHARWCLDQVSHIHQQLAGPAEVEGVARLGGLWPNLRAAFDHACATGDRALADALVRPVVTEIILGRQSELGDWAERMLTITPPAEKERSVFWLAWAAHRYLHTSDRAAYEALLARHGNPDHPLLRYTRAYLYEDGPALAASSADAVAELRRQGEEHAANLTEVAGMASGLLSTGRFQEFDALATTLAGRYRAHGPPTLLHLTLVGLGYSALFQGNMARAEQFFDELASVDVPVGTPSVNQPIEARRAFRRGNRARAFRTLRSHVEELLDSDNTDVARLACVEFINMMTSIERHQDAAYVLRYLETTGDFGVLASTTLIAEATSKTAPTEHSPGRRPTPNARHALAHMRTVLGELAGDPNNGP